MARSSYLEPKLRHTVGRSIIALSLSASVVGCGGRDMAPVHGKVMSGGQPVTSGTLVFSPIAAADDKMPGKSSTGDIEQDGSFQLSTYRAHDGAIVGRHRVRFVPPGDEKINDSSGRSVAKYGDLGLPSDFAVEVKPDEDNEIDITLSRKSP